MPLWTVQEICILTHYSTNKLHTCRSTKAQKCTNIQEVFILQRKIMFCHFQSCNPLNFFSKQIAEDTCFIHKRLQSQSFSFRNYKRYLLAFCTYWSAYWMPSWPCVWQSLKVKPNPPGYLISYSVSKVN